MAYQSALQALADPTRRAIFEALQRESSSVGRLAEQLPVSRPAVSQHLKILKGAGLVTERRDGARRIYGAELNGLVELRRYLDDLWGRALESFRQEAEKKPSAQKGSRRGR